MTLRIAINGFGRIGRCVVRALAENPRKDIKIVAINGTAPIEDMVHFFEYDSVHGKFLGKVTHGEDWINVGFGKIQMIKERDPLQLPWKKLKIDAVLECTGKFTTHAGASKHLEAGAKRVIISAPGKGADATIVYGVNNEVLTRKDKVISIGSCTTNCLAPVAKVLNDAVGIEKGFMTTIHAYTNDQVILDSSHKDVRRARAAGLSMIPTSTGAAKALGLVLPELEGRLDGVAVRVPTPNVSLVDLTFVAKKETSVEAIHKAVKKAANGPLKGVIEFCERPLVSTDYNHNSHSSILDATSTKVVDGDFVRVAMWYDNEWGFSMRMLDVAGLVGKL